MKQFDGYSDKIYFEFKSAARGYQYYRQFWSPTENEVLKCFHERGSPFKVASRVQIWKKTFYQNSDKFCYSFIKKDIMYLLCIYEKSIILSLFKGDRLNFTMYI